MIRKSFLIILCAHLFLKAGNNHPIVLIHGFLGWGPEEMGEYNYWGGTENIADTLSLEGYTVFEISIGPVSSNRDRAVEVYTQLKGGHLDYGKAHSQKYNLIQKPDQKYYQGLYPQWDENNPVHLIGHSMGGQTARVLQYLLDNIFYEDFEEKILEESPLLGKENKGWIRSITTISTPHNGTTVSDMVTNTFPFIQYFIGLAGVLGTRFYDFDLDHWHFVRGSNESWSSYVSRLLSNPIWGTKNISSWDVSLDGAKEINNYATASADIFYFSISTSITEKNKKNFFHSPLSDTPLLVRARAKIIGSHSGYWEDGTETDSLWFENDGLVNTCSMAGPTTGINGEDPITPLLKNEVLIPGQWYNIGPLKLNHWNIIGHKLTTEKMDSSTVNIYKNHAARLMVLP